jgi:hypothetical protein
MPFEYQQSSGQFADSDGDMIATGYSGNGEWMNDPASQSVKDHGPIPQGVYTIGAPEADAETGPVSMRLTPAQDNEMFGRGDFLIHGDTPALNHSASDGCIVLPHEARTTIGAAVLAGDDQLTVVE